jgi:two-component system chemotaxis response regulator CheY
MEIELDSTIFLEEANEIFLAIEKIITSFGEDGVVDELFRHIHTLKGNASIFKFTFIEEITHSFEDLLDLYRKNNLKISIENKNLFLDVKDLLETLTTYYTAKQTIDENLIVSIDFIKEQLKKENLKTHYILRKQEFNKTKEVQQQTQEEIVTPVKPDVSKTILIVDDSSMIRNVASKNAEELGYNVLLASDGIEALNLLEQSKYEISLIFSDINMPQMDGLTLVSHIRKNTQFEFTPIVMMTTEKAQNLKEKGKSLGVKAWLVKPFHKEKFKTVIEKILS